MRHGHLGAALKEVADARFWLGLRVMQAVDAGEDVETLAAECEVDVVEINAWLAAGRQRKADDEARDAERRRKRDAEAAALRAAETDDDMDGVDAGVSFGEPVAE